MPIEILETAKSNPATLSSLAAVASAAFALLGVIVTSFISWSVSRRQIRASLISANRQAWISALRDDRSELWELLEWEHLRPPATFSAQDEAGKKSRIRFLIYRIRLRLNPEELDNQDLLHKIDVMRGSGDEFYDVMEQTVLIAQSILKREWDRVKKAK
ncbi:MAG: hypothetical protein ABSC06_07660 [Rhodopila sp.]|jgi:hypothetical protein